MVSPARNVLQVLRETSIHTPKARKGWRRGFVGRPERGNGQEGFRAHSDAGEATTSTNGFGRTEGFLTGRFRPNGEESEWPSGRFGRKPRRGEGFGRRSPGVFRVPVYFPPDDHGQALAAAGSSTSAVRIRLA